MSEITRSNMIRLASELPVGSEGRKALLARIKAARPVSIRDAEVMLYMIDPRNNKSKFYEMWVVSSDQMTQAKKTKNHSNERFPGFVLERRWGRRARF